MAVTLDGKPLTAVAAGYGVSLGITAQREVTVWGANGAGVGGRVGAVAPATPQRMPEVVGIRDVVTGEFQCAAVDHAGAVFTWGLNLDGALGRPDAAFEAPPGRVTGLPNVRVLAVRPSDVDGELHGLYEPDEELPVARISVWMRTAQKKQVVAFRSFLRTVVHEFLHHLDYEHFKLPETFHTEGFYKRESSLTNALFGVTGIALREPFPASAGSGGKPRG